MSRRADALRWLALAAGCLALLGIAGVLWVSGTGRASADSLGVATTTPTATAPPPPVELPAAPSNLRYEEGHLVWDDNSDNEDGFRIRVSVGGGPRGVVATLPANTTRAPLPDVTAPDPCDPVAFDVVAFNDAGESGPSPALAFIVTDCDGMVPPPTATVEEIVSPPAGAGPTGGDGAAWPLFAAGFGLALAALGGAAVVSYLRLGWVRRRR